MRKRTSWRKQRLAERLLLTSSEDAVASYGEVPEPAHLMIVYSAHAGMLVRFPNLIKG
jgi:hypothetical protein